MEGVMTGLKRARVDSDNESTKNSKTGLKRVHTHTLSELKRSNPQQPKNFQKKDDDETKVIAWLQAPGSNSQYVLEIKPDGTNWEMSVPKSKKGTQTKAKTSIKVCMAHGPNNFSDASTHTHSLSHTHTHSLSNAHTRTHTHTHTL